MTRLIFIRHGKTHKNVAKVLHGAKDDASLNEVGRRQSEISAKILAERNIGVIYSSTELRAKETAQIIGKACNSPIVYIDNFRERNWGTLEERFRYKPEGGESWQEVEERLVLEVKNILKENPGKNIAIVTHGGTIRTLIPYLLGTSRDESFKYDPQHLSFTVFDFKNGKYKKVLIDDVSHLGGEAKI